MQSKNNVFKKVGIGIWATGIFLCFASLVNAQTLTINGVTEHIATVGDALSLRYIFSPGETEATGEVWIDLDRDGAVSPADRLIFKTSRKDEMLIDGGFDDEDGGVNGEFNTSMDDFFPVAPAAYIFVVKDASASAQAILKLNPPPAAFSISGEVILPAGTENLFVFAVPAYHDSTGFKTGGQVRRNAERFYSTRLFFDDLIDCDDRNGPGDPRDMFFATLTGTDGGFLLPLPGNFPMEWYVMAVDRFGVISGFYSPEPQNHFVDHAVAGLEFAFRPSNSQIVGKFFDIFGAPLTDELGDPLEVEVLAFDEFGGHRNAWTAGGEFAMDVLSGKYWLEAEYLHGLYLQPPGMPAQVLENDTVKVEFFLAKLDSAIHGKVAFKDGTPAPCIKVIGMGPNGEFTHTRTHEDGSYWLPASSQIGLWSVFIDEFSLPPFVKVQEPAQKEAKAGDEGVDFVLFKIDAAPHILSIKDVVHDQGLQVRVAWQGSAFDRPADFGRGDFGNPGSPITQYSLWRRGPAIVPDSGAGKAAIGKKKAVYVESIEKMFARRNEIDPGTRFKIDGDRHLWDFITSVPAVQFPAYAHVAPTLHDSTDASQGWSFFLVAAHTPDPFQHFFSLPDSGYSVDNMAPQLLAAQAKATGGGVEISWQIAEAPDVVAGSIYRGETSGFAPEKAVYTWPAHGNEEGHFLDASGAPGNFYRIILTDDAGNQAMSEELEPVASGIVDRTHGAAIPETFTLDQNYPNPFNPSTKITFGLSETGLVKLEIFDLTGRLVAVLLDAELAAGYYETVWNGQDRYGNLLPSGVYIYRLQSAAVRLYKKMTLAK